jgi:hypothetical protein
MGALLEKLSEVWCKLTILNRSGVKFKWKQRVAFKFTILGNECDLQYTLNIQKI